MSGRITAFPVRSSYSLNYLKPHDEIHNKNVKKMHSLERTKIAILSNFINKIT